MIFIERIFILVLLCSFIGTLTFAALASLKANKAKQLSSDALQKALESNSKKKLENVLIVYDKQLDKSVKQKVHARIDDMIIEDIEEIENEKYSKLENK
jgi:glycerol dehydrogenase-like iron-containing ADH family enzyme